MKALKDEAETGEPKPGELTVREGAQINPEDLHATAGRCVNAADQL
jgi:hypothetical protein